MDHDVLGLIKFKNRDLIRDLAGEIPSDELLKQWTSQLGCDQATFLLYEAILNSLEQKNFIDFVYHQKLDQARSVFKNPIEIWIISSSNESLIPWGAHVDVLKSYVSEQGFQAFELVTFSDNNLMQNARLIGETIQASHTKKIIVSFGRGSLEMSLAAKLNEKNKFFDLHSVGAWINIAGSVSGSELVDKTLTSPFFKLHAKIKSFWKREYLHNLLMASKTNATWRSGFSSLKHAISISMLPICFEKHIPVYYKNSFQRLRSLGPNDSQNLTTDQIIRPGFIYPLWGKPLIDEVDIIKQDFLRVIIATENLLNQRQSVDFLREPESLTHVQTRAEY